MNFVEMILPASSDNSLAEDVVDKVLLLMSISMPTK